MEGQKLSLGGLDAVEAKTVSIYQEMLDGVKQDEWMEGQKLSLGGLDAVEAKTVLIYREMLDR